MLKFRFWLGVLFVGALLTFGGNGVASDMGEPESPSFTHNAASCGSYAFLRAATDHVPARGIYGELSEGHKEGNGCSLMGVTGSAIKGIYGTPSIDEKNPESYVEEMEKAGVTAVFVPADRETVRWFKGRGFHVYVSVNAFGGKGAWKTYPDSRPVKADGSLLGSEEGYKGHGGACPTHGGWRNDRLKYVARLVREFGGEGGIDGIWLDFIRYPGVWETETPEIPDTCYCPRCLLKFQKDTGINIPSGLDAAGAAVWIKGHALYKWMAWKKEQIASFVKEVKAIVAETPGKRELMLGVFLAPWSHGERGNAISYLLAQDPFELGRLVDVISPMVYHRMCGKTARWVGYMTDYYKETVKCQVWPIVEAGAAQSEKRRGEWEFGEAMKWAGRGGADGVLVYSFRGMGPGFWERLGEFEGLPDLMGSADYADFAEKGNIAPGAERKAQSGKRGAESAEGKVSSDYADEEGIRAQRHPGETNRKRFHGGGKGAKIEAESSPVPSAGTANDSVSVTAGDEWGEEWVARLGRCEAGVEYQFRAAFWRDGWRNGVYPAVRLWGREFLVDTHLKAREWQPIRVNVVCPDEVTDPTFRFINRNRGTTFRLREPSVKRMYRFEPEPGVSVMKGFFKGDFFPIGVYGADLGSLEEIKRLAVNTVILGGSGENLRDKVERCHEVGLRYVVSTPHDPDRLVAYLDDIARYVRPYDMAFYVNDEPGIWSFPVNRANDINRLIKGRFPGCATCMAVVRPQVCGDYGQSADFFMLDQYPVPHMPMTWLGDCMGECAKGIAQSSKLKPESSNLEARREAQKAEEMAQNGPDKSSHLSIPSTQYPIPSTQYPIPNTPPKRLAAVIQAFGGDRWKDVGWPRVPTWQEMDCLAFLSVVHGARGIFFFTYGVIGKTAEGREALGRVVGRLNQVYSWLVEENLDTKVQVEMISENRVDPKGRPAVQGCIKKKGKDLLVIAVNTIGTGVEALLGSADDADFRTSETQSCVKKARELFSGEEYGIRDGKLRVRLGAYETKAFLSADYSD